MPGIGAPVAPPSGHIEVPSPQNWEATCTVHSPEPWENLHRVDSVPSPSGPPETSACDLIWKQGLCRGNQVKMRSYLLEAGPRPKTGVLTRGEKSAHRGTQKEEDAKGGEDGGPAGTSRGLRGQLGVGRGQRRHLLGAIREQMALLTLTSDL